MQSILQTLWNHFFILDTSAVETYNGTYSVPLILLSFLIAAMGSFTALRISHEMYLTKDSRRRRLLHAVGALSLGAGIWTMHFIGMLSYRMEMQMTYDPLLTTLSLAIAAGVAWAVLHLVQEYVRLSWRIIPAGVLLGLAICGMHYVGMAAMEMDAHIRYIPMVFLASVFVASVASTAALAMMIYLRQSKIYDIALWQVTAAIIMGFAICGMHYTGMAATVMIPFADCRFVDFQSYDFIVVCIALASGTLFASGLLLARHAPEDSSRTAEQHTLRRGAYSGQTVFIHLLGLLGVFVLLISGSYFFLSSRIHAQTDESRVMNAVTIQRMLLTRYSYYASLALASDPEEVRYSQQRMQENAAAIDQNFNAFTMGGRIIFSADIRRNAAFDRFTSPQVRAAFSRAQTAWLRLKTHADRMATTPPVDLAARKDAQKTLEGLMMNAVATQDAAVITAQDFQEEKYESLSSAQQSVLVAGIILFMLALAYARYFISGPLDRARRELDESQWNLERLVVEKTNEYRLAKEEAEKASSAKSDFLACMSHELRTPLNSILGLSRILAEDENIGTDKHGMMQTVKRSAENLLAIVNDVLDISKIEARQMMLENIGFDFDATLRAVTDILRPMASDKKITLDVRYAGDIKPPFIKGDPLRMQRILTNLIHNAVKYTDIGSVSVDISTLVNNEDTVEIDVRITDTGIGIAAADQKIIFQKFTQADQSLTRRYGGTGLGLAITRDLVELMGGRIDVESMPGIGSVFHFAISFKIASGVEVPASRKFSALPRPVPVRRPVAVARVLVAEDHPLNQLLIGRLLARIGITHVDIVENGARAVSAAREGDYDLILMDCHMPEMSGYEATQEIRAFTDAKKSAVPIVALTANAMPGTRQKCLDIGMDEYMSKPIDAADFARMLATWFILPDTTSPVASVGEAAIDLSSLRSYVDKPEDLDAYVNIYLQQTQTDLEKLAAVCHEGDNSHWVEVAHRLKGGAGMVGAKHLQSLCAQAQHMNPASATDRRRILDDMYAAFAEARQFLLKNMSSVCTAV